MNKFNEFDKLVSIDVGDYIEKKGGLSYLSWANAWREFCKVYDSATYEVVKNEQGLPFFKSDEGYMVYTKVTAGNVTHEMWLPVMDFKNKAMKNATMTDINKAVMRCLTKNLAMFGLGLYIYAGEDLPEPTDEDGKPVKKENPNFTKAKALVSNSLKAKETKADIEKMRNNPDFKAMIMDLEPEQQDAILKMLDDKYKELS